jgi:hypothetical protein
VALSNAPDFVLQFHIRLCQFTLQITCYYVAVTAYIFVGFVRELCCYNCGQMNRNGDGVTHSITSVSRFVMYIERLHSRLDIITLQ